MSLRPEPTGPVPEETARVARAAFPRSNPWLRLRDELGTIYSNETFAALEDVPESVEFRAIRG